MTPGNIAGMAAVNGLGLVALTDHNSTKNCPAFFAQARRCGIVPVAGMELTTSEDIHVVCLFPTLEDAMAFGDCVDARRVRVRNKPALFGHQYILDAEDRIVGEEADLLLNATTISLEEAPALVDSFRGVCYPAHIDRPSNGIVTILGAFPEDTSFSAFELKDGAAEMQYRTRFPHIAGMPNVVSSDAHYLWDMAEAVHSLELADVPYSSAAVRRSLLAFLRGEVPHG